MARRGGIIGRGLELLEEATGRTLVDVEHLRVTEAVAGEAYALANELEEFGYVSMDYMAGRPNEPTAVARRRWAQQARIVYQTDPQAGAAVELRNEFTFGRGVPRPRAKDEKVQEVLDEFWDDPQNRRVLTTFTAQMKLGTSLTTQSNVFPLLFDDGEDGKVQLSFLNHDSVVNAMTDPANRQRVLFFIASKKNQEWDFERNAPKMSTDQPKLYYYEAWGAVEEALRERGLDDTAVERTLEKLRSGEGNETIEIDGEDDDDKLVLPPPARVGRGKVYHLSENTDMEQVFGTPRMRRTMRWYTAYNDYMKARVDVIQAGAAFVMVRKVKGTPNQLEKMATKAMRATSDLRATAETTLTGAQVGPRPASILSETESVSHEPFNFNTQAGNANQDAQMLRAQVSAGDRFPQHYLGDVGSANLATATSMELPVLKHIEAFQELVEGLFHWALDRAVERAVEVNKLDKSAPGKEEEVTELVRTYEAPPELTEGAVEREKAYEGSMLWRINGEDVLRETTVWLEPDGSYNFELLAEAHEDKAVDEETTERDLSYEFGMPSPLRRMMGDLVTAAVQTAQTLDPNNTNIELTRTVAALIFSEAFEMQDATDLVDRIWPKGYVPPELAAMQAAQGGGQGAPTPGNFFGPDATDQPPDPGNAYGAPQQATAPERVPGAQEAAVEEEPVLITVGRAGQPVIWPGRRRPQVGDVPVGMKARVNGRTSELSQLFDEETRAVTMEALGRLTMNRLVDETGNGKE